MATFSGQIRTEAKRERRLGYRKNGSLYNFAVDDSQQNTNRETTDSDGSSETPGGHRGGEPEGKSRRRRRMNLADSSSEPHNKTPRNSDGSDALTASPETPPKSTTTSELSGDANGGTKPPPRPGAAPPRPGAAPLRQSSPRHLLPQSLENSLSSSQDQQQKHLFDLKDLSDPHDDSAANQEWEPRVAVVPPSVLPKMVKSPSEYKRSTINSDIWTNTVIPGGFFFHDNSFRLVFS